MSVSLKIELIILFKIAFYNNSGSFKSKECDVFPIQPNNSSAKLQIDNENLNFQEMLEERTKINIIF